MLIINHYCKKLLPIQLTKLKKRVKVTLPISPPARAYEHFHGYEPEIISVRRLLLSTPQWQFKVHLFNSHDVIENSNQFTRNDGSSFKLIALIRVNGSLNFVFRQRGTSSTTRTMYRMCPNVASIDDGMFDGSINSNE